MLNKNARRIAFVSGLGFAALVSSLVVPTICSANNANAEAGEPVASETSLTISSTNDQALLTVIPVSDAKSFGVSDADGTAAFSVTTNNYTGYTLGIAASDDEGKLTNVDLADNSTHYLYSIASSLNASAFNNATYTNKWGFRPNKYVDNNVVVNNTGEYAVFLPAPTTTPTILDHTSVANENANDYTIALGARVDGSTYPGSYTATMNLIALANVVNYTISFDKNTDDDVTNMPATIGGATADMSITLPSNTPERAYHLFRGWCTVETTNTQCSGNTFQPSDEFGIDQTSVNAATLYAIWETKPYMQDYDYAALLEMLPNVEDSITLYDKRDDKTYTVTRIADGNIWMTENLNIAGGTELTPALSNVATNYTLPASSATGFDSDTKAYVYNTGVTECSEDSLSTPCDSYYSYIAATAGTNPESGDAPYDICPKGWRMPTKEDYEKLMTVYPTVAALHEGVWNGQYGGVMVNNIFGHNGGLIGEFMASTAEVLGNGAPGAYYVFLNERNETAPVWTANKRNGQFVRCISKIEYIQDYDQEELAAALPNIGDTINLYDKRDTKKYTIGKLADGNYWFLDNLRLDLTTVDASTLKGNTNASDSTIDYLKGNTTGTANDRYATSAVSYVPTGEDDDKTSFSDPYIDVTVIDDTTSAGYTIGTYYNYCAATAGSYCFGDGYDFGEPSGDAMEDICPKDWRLPTGGDNGEFAELYNAYSNDRSALVSAARLSLSGFNNGAPANINSNGGFWSSNYQNFMNMKVLYLTTSAVSQTATDRKVGYPVRCIYIKKAYMQDYGYEDLLGLLPNAEDSITLWDKRDGKSYTVTRMNDNNIWMTTNLELDGGTELTPELSNVTSNYTLPASSNTSGFDSDSAESVYNSNSKECTSTSPCYSYYTYAAANAGDNPSSGDSAGDICPKGWRLPSQDDFGRLVDTYGEQLATSPWGEVYTGEYYGTALQQGGFHGSYWSSTAHGEKAYSFYSQMYREQYASIGHNYGVPENNKRWGFQVRCISKIEFIQDYDQNDLATALPNAGDTIDLYDKRDLNKYTIGKLADGKYWLLDNLRLDLTNTATKNRLSSENTNASDEALGYLKNGGGDSNDQYAVSAVTGWSGDNYMDPKIDTSKKDEAGIFYNFCAASAGSYCYKDGTFDDVTALDAVEDICPKGWRLPTGGASGELQKVYSAYNNSSSYLNALNISATGFYNASIFNPTTINYIWSSTGKQGNLTHASKLDGSTVDPQSSYYRRYGLSVRCVFGKTLFMQDTTDSDLAVLAPNVGDTVELYDRRDGEKYTIGKLADGKYWVLENLRLDPVAVSLAKLKGNTNATDTSLTYLKNGGGTSNYAAVGVINDASAASFTNPQVHTGDKNVMQTSTIEDGQTWQNKLGVYYNFCAATAGSYCYANTPADDTPDPTEDLCPSGWHMPRGNGYDGDALTLRNSFATDQNINLKAALKTTLGGYYSEGEGAIKNNGTHGYIWESMWFRKTSTRSDAYDIFVTSGSTNSVVLSSSQAANVYSVRCVADKPEPAKTYIQDVTIETCPTEPTIVYDKRDEEEYTIQKLADDRCWLLDNLRLDLIAVSADALKGNTNASDTTINYLKNGGGNDQDQYATSGVANWTSSFSYSAPLISTTNKNTTGTGGYAAGKYGVYYNYCAASAGSYCYGYDTTQGASSGDATEDICPAGWRMPTGNSSGEYKILYTAYDSDYNTFVNALRTPLPGRFYSGSVRDLGSVGVFWSSTRSSSGYMYNLEVQTSSVDSQDYIRRQDGHSVRCILKE